MNILKTGYRSLQLTAISLLLLSCMGDFRKSTFRYTENGVAHETEIVVPKKFRKVVRNTDSAGNEQQVYYYSGGGMLYFARTRDSLKEYQPINLEEHIPLQLYGSQFFKGVDGNGLYYRENRNYPFRSGYRYVGFGNDWLFDSSLNYFSLRKK